MSNTLDQLNNFLAEKGKKKKQDQQTEDMLKLRDRLMQDKVLACYVNTFINNRPPGLRLTTQQMDYITWVFIIYLISSGAIKIIIKH